MSFQGEPYIGVPIERPEATKGFVFNHTMLRIKDPIASLKFYSQVLGMRVLRKVDFAEFSFSLYFLAFIDNPEDLAADMGERTQQTFGREGVLELTHNWGSESDDSCQYHNGNDAPQGFGHICISVPDIHQAVAWFDKNQVSFKKRLEDGNLRNIAFIQDPDGYWIEIVQADKMGGLV